MNIFVQQTKYSSVVSRPMDVGSIVSKLCEAEYSNVDELRADFDLIVNNCDKYYSKFDKDQVCMYMYVHSYMHICMHVCMLYYVCHVCIS